MICLSICQNRDDGDIDIPSLTIPTFFIENVFSFCQESPRVLHILKSVNKNQKKMPEHPAFPITYFSDSSFLFL